MLEELTSLQSFYEKARTLVSADVFSFIDGGSLDELAVKRNRQHLNDIRLVPRVLRGLGEISAQTQIFGHNLSTPVLIAPSAYHGLLSPKGELDMLEAANQFNTIMILSMFASVDHILVAQNKKGPLWLQMYFLQDRSINKNFIQMAQDNHFDALVVTVDAPVYAKKERECAQPLKFPDNTSFAHLERLGIPINQCLKTKKHLSTLLDHQISWDDLDWLAQETQLPIILKGILDPRDTEIALGYPNVKGIIISNHGGRQLDSSCTAVEIMKEHKQVVGDKVKLFLDGGIARGSDVFKALALGADATLIGRAALWALAAGGSKGVFHALSILQRELIETMILCGCASTKDITSDFIKL
ncbi:alpha-hydroxy acid oxidase [Legionella quateirensis]|uniref:FMN-dependent dehydrogenase n=2 Tax=Legionella quateirensis TaxID=45072 RepID=A0A378KRY5_9GAMM|nr:alpha-hydroxy acid oxidase [Legionella quateirensis]KTD43667.1 FMN-dependent dehydrogenase [Legionella quateirensis]STY17345.1 FMN-dependent dehydrogenase [Legionella quateirensis]